MELALDLALAGLPTFRLESPDPRWSAALMPRYGAFAREAHQARAGAAAPATTRLRLTATSPPPDAIALARNVAESVDVERATGGWTLRTSWCRVAFDRRSGLVEIEGPLHRVAVDLALRHLLTEQLADGLLLHGALLVEGERTFLCAGPSGCGKSTLAALLPEQALCDELAVARREAAGGWRAWSLPFWHGRPGSGRLAGVHLLAHGARAERRSLAPSAAWRRLAPEVIWPAHDEVASRRAFELLGLLALEVPVSALAFRPEPEVWTLISSPAAA